MPWASRGAGGARRRRGRGGRAVSRRAASHCAQSANQSAPPAPSRASDGGGDAVEQEAIVGDEDERAGELGEALLEHLERRDVEIVGGLVEQQQVGGLEHEAGEVHAGALAAREPRHRQRELLGPEEEALGPGGDVQRAPLVDDAVGLGRERAAQRLVGVEPVAVLVEVRDAQSRRALDLARGRAPACRRAGGAAWSCRCRSGR